MGLLTLFLIGLLILALKKLYSKIKKRRDEGGKVTPSLANICLTWHLPK